jgi:hypothetical protein
MKKTLLLLCLTAGVLNLVAQDAPEEKVLAAGNKVEYTLRLTRVAGCSDNIYINVGDVTDVTSINEVSVESRVYPNPVGEVLNIPLHPESGKTSLILLLDSNGKLLESKTGSVNESLYPLSLAKYEAGVYFVQVIDAKKITHKIIKK